MRPRDTSEPDDAPVIVFFDQRHRPSRRAVWRGGRRNTDWFNRPIGAWRNLEQRLTPWRQWIAKLSPKQSDQGSCPRS
jgi:hypothetical protein